MTAYTPRAGDLARDHDGETWYVYADPDQPDRLYGVTASYDPKMPPHSIRDVQDSWGPLRLEYRPDH